MPILAAECNSYEVNLEDFLSGLDEGFSQSDALDGNRAAYTTSDSPVKPYSNLVEGYRQAQNQELSISVVIRKHR